MTRVYNEPDRISFLPDFIIHQILSNLSIKEAGRTSVLSSNWRKKWSTQPVLVFDSQCVSSETSQHRSVIESKFVSIIDHVLLLHSGPINTFEVSDSNTVIIGVNSMAHIDRWILHLIGRSIKALVLDIRFKQRYKIPWCLFSCQSLLYLKLFSCLLKPPTTFKGFSNLKILELERVTMDQDAFERLISGSPLLEELTLIDFDGFTQINIRAPNLKLIQFIGKFEDISFNNTSQLAPEWLNLKLYSNSENNQSRLHGGSSNLLNFFDHLPNIQHLHVMSYFMKYLAAGDVPVELPTPCINITSACFGINFNDLKQISVFLCLLKSSPNLQKAVKIFVQLEEQTSLLTPASYCWEDIYSEPNTPLVVRHLRIEGISGTKSELDFIRFLLLYSPMLEKMILKPVVNVKPELMIELLRFRRASTRAEIIYHGNDSS
ncbi:hypothetical protein TSUD_07360 [Trifolium subterraneum]|uniref:FBD domain-containing protein n=1 Tax=Trifolium subterraneum TaxID=3900 RepID=A0A2Z6M6V1_TRISU|nr:hypothetical protein TSUD_07360 [Trifolium subterraneum]